MMNLSMARDRVAEVLYRATALVERQNTAGVWIAVYEDLPCSVRAQQAQPVSAQPDSVAQGQGLLRWRLRCSVGTGLQVGDRITATTPDYGIVPFTLGSVMPGSLTVSETAYGTREEWSVEGMAFTFIRFDQDTDTEVTHGPYFGRVLSNPPNRAVTGGGSIGAPLMVSIRLADTANVEVGDIVPELGGGVVEQVRPAVDGDIEIMVRVDAGVAESLG